MAFVVSIVKSTLVVCCAMLLVFVAVLGDGASIELKLKSLETKVDQIKTMISRQGNVPTACTITVSSYASKYFYIRTNGGSWEYVSSRPGATSSRGLILLELNPMTCRTMNRQNFDFDTDSDDKEKEALQFEEYFESSLTGTIIFGASISSLNVTDDDGGEDVLELLRSYDVDVNLESGDAFVFILQKGYPKKTIFHDLTKNSTRSSSIVFQSQGTSVAGVTFRRKV